jgi:hypothetical protein
VLAVADQPLSQRPADAMGALHRPATLRSAFCPLAQLLVAVEGGGDTLLAEQLAVLVQRGGSVGGLVGVDADHHRHGAPFSRANRSNREGRPPLG